MVRSGRYVLAVSGGVDSMTLLHALASASRQDLALVVAHYDHGIRPDSAEDRRLVASQALHYGLQFEHEEGRLGAHVSEAVAREKRYAFLDRIAKKYNAQAIMTAHHKDDVIETMIINLLRGTGRKGLSSLRSTSRIVRPLLSASKADIFSYAEQHNITWREDSTNSDPTYLRNYIRHELLPLARKRSASVDDDFLAIATHMYKLNVVLDEELARVYAAISLEEESNVITLSRYFLIMVPANVAREVLLYAIRRLQVDVEVRAKQLDLLLHFVKTGKPRKMFDISKEVKVVAQIQKIVLKKYSTSV